MENALGHLPKNFIHGECTSNIYLRTLLMDYTLGIFT